MNEIAPVVYWPKIVREPAIGSISERAFSLAADTPAACRNARTQIPTSMNAIFHTSRFTPAFVATRKAHRAVRRQLGMRIGFVLFATGGLPYAEAQIVNGNFETGDTSGWTTVIPVDFSPDQGGNFLVGVVEATDDFSITNNVSFGTKISHFEGSYALAVATHKSAYSATGSTFDITVSQSLNLQAGDKLSGWAAWYNGDYEHQDTVWVKIFDSLGTEIASPWSRLSGGGSPDGVAFLDASPWTHWEWISPEADTFTLVLGATTFGDNRFATVGLHDGIQFTAIPEPTTYAAILSGLALTVVAIRRVRRRAARR